MRCYPLQADQHSAHRSCLSLPRLPARHRQRLRDQHLDRETIRGSDRRDAEIIHAQGRHRQGSRGVLLRQLRHLRMEPLPGRARRRSACSSARGRSTIPTRSSPTFIIFTRSKLPWLRLPEGATRVRNGLQNRRRLAGREQGAPAASTSPSKASRFACQSVVAADLCCVSSPDVLRLLSSPRDRKWYPAPAGCR